MYPRKMSKLFYRLVSGLARSIRVCPMTCRSSSLPSSIASHRASGVQLR